ncbi:DegQ family serine endoprotease [Caenispirillum salinarum]|uniref:DegQ family serine endoprotease n=1 Tax=Caenispirillum salinarum TaxID=859058 RepID=UPI00384EB758
MTASLTFRRAKTRRAALLLAAAGASLVAVGQTAAAAPMPETFSPLVEKVSPAVVTITAEKAVRQATNELSERYGRGSPFEEFFRRFGHPEAPQGPRGPGGKSVGLGSGFIIDGDDGYVVTNNHVIDGADSVSIQLTDGTTLDAEVIGTDAKTDIALLKVESAEDLPFVSFGDSDGLKVGDWVMAVGNPFGLGGTVTAGIVSARGRAIGNDPLDDFIQTDAAINKGNSGGPMFSTDGAVMGVNTAIYSPNGGSVGIGFAVPANVAKPVIAQLKENGEVRRGWLGVSIQPVTPEIAEAMDLSEDATQGALISQVTDDTPAMGAGMKAGDVITAVDGQPVAEMRDLPRMIAAYKPGDTVDLTVLRDGKEKSLSVELGRLPTQQVASAEGDGQGSIEGKGELGLALAPVTPELAEQLGLDADAEGAVIAQVDPTGPAAERGLRQGDVIVKANGSTVANPQDVINAVSAAKKAEKDSVLLLVRRDGGEIFVPVKLRSA